MNLKKILSGFVAGVMALSAMPTLTYAESTSYVFNYGTEKTVTNYNLGASSSQGDFVVNTDTDGFITFDIYAPEGEEIGFSQSCYTGLYLLVRGVNTIGEDILAPYFIDRTSYNDVLILNSDLDGDGDGYCEKLQMNIPFTYSKYGYGLPLYNFSHAYGEALFKEISIYNLSIEYCGETQFTTDFTVGIETSQISEYVIEEGVMKKSDTPLSFADHTALASSEESFFSVLDMTSFDMANLPFKAIHKLAISEGATAKVDFSYVPLNVDKTVKYRINGGQIQSKNLEKGSSSLMIELSNEDLYSSAGSSESYLGKIEFVDSISFREAKFTLIPVPEDEEYIINFGDEIKTTDYTYKASISGAYCVIDDSQNNVNIQITSPNAGEATVVNTTDDPVLIEIRGYSAQTQREISVTYTVEEYTNENGTITLKFPVKVNESDEGIDLSEFEQYQYLPIITLLNIKNLKLQLEGDAYSCTDNSLKISVDSRNIKSVYPDIENGGFTFGEVLSESGFRPSVSETETTYDVIGMTEFGLSQVELTEDQQRIIREGASAQYVINFEALENDTPIEFTFNSYKQPLELPEGAIQLTWLYENDMLYKSAHAGNEEEFLGNLTINGDLNLKSVYMIVVPYQGVAGDANGDYEVNIRDVVALYQSVSNWDNAIEEKNADVNGDGDINIRDVVLLFQYTNRWDVALQ